MEAILLRFVMLIGSKAIYCTGTIQGLYRDYITYLPVFRINKQQEGFHENSPALGSSNPEPWPSGCLVSPKRSYEGLCNNGKENGHYHIIFRV